MAIDRNGRLFGRFSIASLLVLLLVAAAVAGVGYKLAKSKTVTPFTRGDAIEIQFYCEEAPEFIVKSITPGAVVKDPTRNVEFGVVKDMKADKSRSPAMNSKGELVDASKPGFNSLTLTVDGKGVYGTNGVTFDNVDYYVGNWIVALRIGNSTLEGVRIAGLSKIK